MFQIPSLDGGGIKGLFSAAALAALEEDLGTPVVDHFDLVAGTSTGGIIALALAYGLSPKRVVEFYIEHGRAIFPSSLGIRALTSLGVRKYSQRSLREALQTTFGDATLSECNKRLVIPSFSLSEDDVYLFRTAHHHTLKRDYRVPIWQVALATSAAPTYFPVCTHVDGCRLIDGGVWANNPVMVALTEAHGVLGVPLSEIRVFSLGTSEEVPKRRAFLNWGGKLLWGASSAAIDVVMRGQSAAANNQARFFLGRERILRVSPKVPAGEFSLDGIERADQLIAKARHHSRMFVNDYERLFCSHRAEPFQSMRRVVAANGNA